MSENHGKGKKRSKSFYRKCAYGTKKQCLSANVLEPGICGFLVMCNHNEKSAVRESYNILNEYASTLYGRDKPSSAQNTPVQTGDDCESSEEDTDEDDDVEKALKKEVDEMKNIVSSEKRFQNVKTKAKNCVFIRTTLKNPVEIGHYFMEDIAVKKLKRARYAARILPIVGTCKANTSDIEKLASEVLSPVFSPSEKSVPQSYTIIFKSRNNNGNTCGREGVVSSLTKIVKNINSDVRFTWSDYNLAILVEIVCNVCCIGVAPDFIRLRKYNLQELSKGPLINDICEQEVKDEDSTKESCGFTLDSNTGRESDDCVNEETKKLEEKNLEDISKTIDKDESETKSSVEKNDAIPIVEGEDVNIAQIPIDPTT